MRASTTFRRGFISVLVTCAVVGGGFVVEQASAQVRWTNHIDASMINEVVQKDGILYMATFGGLVLYNVGNGQFEQLDNVDGLPSNALRCLMFDNADNLYIGTADFGVAKVRFSNGRPNVVRSLNAQIDGLASNVINSIAPWGSDIVYGANPGMGTIRNDFASARYFERDGLPDDDVRDVLGDGDHAWIATGAGVAVLDELGLIRRPTGAPAIANVLGSDGAFIYAGTNDGVFRFNPADSTWTDIGPDTRIIHGLYWDGANLWAGSTRNLCRYTGSGQTWDQFATAPVVGNYGAFAGGGGALQIRAMAKAGSDLYLGSVHPTEGRGVNLMRFDGSTFTNFIPNAPGGNNVLRLSVDVDGSVWAMFANFYVGKLLPSGGWLNYNSAVAGIQIPSHQFTNLALLADSQGYKWFCSLPSPTLDQLDDRSDASYANDTWIRHSQNSGGGDGLGTLNLQRGKEDPAGNRWFLSDIDGIQILRRDGSEWFEMTPLKDARMVSGDVVDVAFGGTFAYVAHRAAGIQLWALDGFDWPTILDTAGDAWQLRIAETDFPGGARVSAIELRSDNVLWIASDAGLFRYPPTRGQDPFDTIPVYTGLGAGILTSKVRDIILDHDENLWVATELGLNKIARNDNGDIQTYTTAAAYVTSLADLRYPLSIISPLSNAVCLSLAMHPSRDVLYIGTLAGVSVLDYTPRDAVATDLSTVYLYPNPVYRSRGQNEIMIANITGPVTIEVYNLEGVLVHTQAVEAEGEVAWDLTTKGGFVASSGNYLVRVIGPSSAITKPIAVLR